MSSLPNAKLVYGYELGDPVEGMEVRERDDEGGLKTAWYDWEDDPDEVIRDFPPVMTRVLYESIPGVPVDVDDWDRRETVREQLGVWFEAHGNDGTTRWLLVAEVHDVDCGERKAIRPEALRRRPADMRDSVDGRQLAHALTVLGLTPLQPRPEWLLVAEAG